jgi:prepilin-type N-terminal cleavage/methylation domain-containing protein
MSNRKGFTLIELMIVVTIIGILAAIAIPNFINMQNLAREDEVKSNAHAVQLAAERFAVKNNGKYATSVDDVLPSGITFIQLLPGGHLLKNPFTKVADSPIDGVDPNVGQIGYISVDDNGDGEIDGYQVTGFGKKAQILFLTNQ